MNWTALHAARGLPVSMRSRSGDITPDPGVFGVFVWS